MSFPQTLFNKEQAKGEVRKLIEKYVKLETEGKTREYNEERTKMNL
jgi:hypothetical protein